MRPQPAEAGLVTAVAEGVKSESVGVDGEGDAHLLAELNGGAVQVDVMGSPGRSAVGST